MLFVALLSNLLAGFLQALSIRLGTASGLNLAEACRAFLPRWLSWMLYGMALVAIVATQFTEVCNRISIYVAVSEADHDTKVVTVAIVVNIMNPSVPLATCGAASIGLVLLTLLLYAPERRICFRYVEFLAMFLTVTVVVCFILKLKHITHINKTSRADVFRGFLPSASLTELRALHHACSIISAIMVPHTLYLGSGLVQGRLRDFDVQSGRLPADLPPSPAGDGNLRHPKTHQPSVAAVRHCLRHSNVALFFCLFISLIVSSAVLVVSGASFYGGGHWRLDAEQAFFDGIRHMVYNRFYPLAGVGFISALILSGLLALVVCTMAGQMVSEGALPPGVRWWVPRLLTVIPSTAITIAGAAADMEWLAAALRWTSAVQSVVMPVVVVPLLYFTSLERCERCFPCAVPGPTRPTRRCLLGVSRSFVGEDGEDALKW